MERRDSRKGQHKAQGPQYDEPNSLLRQSESAELSLPVDSSPTLPPPDRRSWPLSPLLDDSFGGLAVLCRQLGEVSRGAVSPAAARQIAKQWKKENGAGKKARKQLSAKAPSHSTPDLGSEREVPHALRKSVSSPEPMERSSSAPTSSSVPRTASASAPQTPASASASAHPPLTTQASYPRRRRLGEEPERTDEDWVVVKRGGDERLRVAISKKASLYDARQAILDAIDGPLEFAFWPSTAPAPISRAEEGSTSVANAFPSQTKTIFMDVDFIHTFVGDEALTPDELFSRLVQFQEEGHTLSHLESQIIKSGLYDFCRIFDNRCSRETFLTFRKFFGNDPSSILQRVLEIYSIPYFHSFMGSQEVKEVLKNTEPGTYLVRYSQTGLNEGLYVLSVNKGSSGDGPVISSYQFRFDPLADAYVFGSKDFPEVFPTIKSMVSNERFAGSLLFPLTKQ